MSRECLGKRKDNVPVPDLRDGQKIIAEGIIESSAVHISLVIASVVSLAAAILMLTHVRFGIFASLCLLSFVFATAGLLIGFGASKERITVTEKYVLVRDIFGKELYLNTDSVTAVGASCLNTVHVLSDACKMKCMFVKNNEEIVAEIRRLIEEKKNELSIGAA